MCQVTRINTASIGNQSIPLNNEILTTQCKPSNDGLRVLLCSENVPPQVNGIARRIGMYADGLEKLGCDVGEYRHMFETYPRCKGRVTSTLVLISENFVADACNLGLCNNVFSPALLDSFQSYCILALVATKSFNSSIHGISPPS
jgi:hypothetical protein